MKRLPITCAILTLASIGVTGSCGVGPVRPNAQLDQMLSANHKPGEPGVSVAVSQNGRIVYERAFGMASLELGVPVTPESVFQAASISKQFTAMSIMLLAQQEKLSIDDPIQKYLPELPDYGTPLTVRHLLSHTGGLRDAFLLLELFGPDEGGGDRNDRLLSIVARQRGLNFTPGAESAYNNGAYAMLAVIVRRVSGQSLADFADANIFKPLGMTSTRFHDDPTAIVPNRVSNYSRQNGIWRIEPPPTVRGAVGNSGLMTNPRDLLRWAGNFTEVRVGSAAMLTDMQTATRLANGTPTMWGLGFEIGEHRGLKYVGHGGGDPGISTYVGWYPDARLSIAIMSNTDDGTHASELTRRVAEVLLADRLTPVPSGEKDGAPNVSVPESELRAKEGLYGKPAPGDFVRAFVRDGKLALDTVAGEAWLTPASTSRFVIPGTPIVVDFLPEGSAPPRQLRVTGARPQPEVLDWMKPFAPSRDDLQAYLGDYVSPDVDTTFTVVVTDSGLAIRRLGRPDIRLEPVFKDTFGGLVAPSFTRDPRGAVTGFVHSSAGVRHLRFERVRR
jgi:CubicO group peptidase (beta-lactamase class C family)